MRRKARRCGAALSLWLKTQNPDEEEEEKDERTGTNATGEKEAERAIATARKGGMAAFATIIAWSST